MDYWTVGRSVVNTLRRRVAQNRFIITIILVSIYNIDASLVVYSILVRSYTASGRPSGAMLMFCVQNGSRILYAASAWGCIQIGIARSQVSSNCKWVWFECGVWFFVLFSSWTVHDYLHITDCQCTGIIVLSVAIPNTLVGIGQWKSTSMCHIAPQ